MGYEFPPEQQEIIDRIKEHGQKHVLRWLGELSEEERGDFLDQLDQVDFSRLEEFRRLMEDPPAPRTLDDIRPAPVEELPHSGEQAREESPAIDRGQRALEDDRVAALTVAGGQGTRLGYEGPKGTFPITPVRHNSLFRVLAEKVLAARRHYGSSMPWLVMTSPTNDAETRAFFEKQEFFGLGEQSVHFFQQGTHPILGPDGQLLLSDKGTLLVGPDGHGGVFRALCQSGVAERLMEENFDLISYFQVDNPLVTVADERFIGHHLNQEADFSCKVIPKRSPEEGLGVAVLDSGRPAVVEYIDLPEEMAREKTESGELKYLYGSIAVHVIGTQFAHQLGKQRHALPWHVAEKNYESIDENGESAERKCYKFERFVFDCLTHAEGCAFVEARRETEFAPVKNAEGQDSPQTCRRALHEMWVEWMREAGVDAGDLAGPEEGTVEISPLYANSAEELKERLPQDFKPTFSLVLEE